MTNSLDLLNCFRNKKSQLFKSTLILSSLYLFVPAVHAEQTVPSLAWTQCEVQAQKNNPDLAFAWAKLNESKADKAVTQSGALPQISANLSASTQKRTAATRSESYDYGVSAQQLLFNGFKTIYDIRAQQANVSAAAYNYAVVSSSVRLNLRTAFIDLLNAQESVKVFTDIAKRRKQELDSVALRYQGGAENRGSLFKAQANWAEAQYNLVSAQRDQELSQRRLEQVMGWEQFTPISVTEDFNLGTADRTEPPFEDMIKSNPFLRQLVAQKEAARLGVKSAQADFFPQIYANAGAGKIDASWPPRQNSWSAGLSVSLPLFEGGLQQAQLARAKAILDQAQAQQRSGQNSVLFILVNAWIQWQNSMDNVAVQEKFLIAARERAKIAEVEYTAGLMSFNEWIIIEDELVNAQKSFLNVQTNALMTEASWRQARGDILDEEK
jgi:outer membrane protein TolC